MPHIPLNIRITGSSSVDALNVCGCTHRLQLVQLCGLQSLRGKLEKSVETLDRIRYYYSYNIACGIHIFSAKFLVRISNLFCVN
jgi:hypothetical protein